jgi:hypothetical protein
MLEILGENSTRSGSWKRFSKLNKLFCAKNGHFKIGRVGSCSIGHWDEVGVLSFSLRLKMSSEKYKSTTIKEDSWGMVC